MSQADFWYVRFPDGRVLRAASTTILRQELSARRIPLGSTVRRSPNDEWVSLEWTQEFADLAHELATRPARNQTAVPSTMHHAGSSALAPSSDYSENHDKEHPATVGSRLDPSRLHLVGVRGYLDELLTALDSTLVAKKLLLCLISSLALGFLFVLISARSFEFEYSSWLMVWLTVGVALLVILDGICALLTRLTYLELAGLRPPTWREGFHGLGRLTVGIVVSQLIVCGVLGALILLFRWLPYWLVPGAEESWTQGQKIIAGTSLTLGMLLEVLLYPVFLLWWLLPPLLAAESCPVWSGLAQWLSSLRGNLGSVFLYQALAVAVGGLVSLPLLLLISALFLPLFQPPDGLQEVASGVRAFLLGLAYGPLWTFWVTANVFIYLNVRYGASNRR
jgi:hypothetical protein